jgi:hypothetical protein
MTEAQSAFRERPESQEARKLLEELAPHVWAEWEREMNRRIEYSSCPAAVSQDQIWILKYLRDGRRFESAGMFDEALEMFREAEIRMLLLPSESVEISPQSVYLMAREAIARLSSPDGRKR